MADTRLPLPAAYIDPAFNCCLAEAIAEPELVQQFCRLYGSKLNTPERTDDDMSAFTAFVHDGIYLRLPDEAIHSLRAGANAMTPAARKAKPTQAA